MWLDADEDGDLDLLTTSWPDVLLFENRVGQERGWVELDLRGTTTNRDAIGARVTLTAGGVTQLRDVPGGGGVWTNQGSRIVHFGLGDETQVDTLTVRRVGGATETFTGVDPNGRYQLVEGAGVAAPLP